MSPTTARRFGPLQHILVMVLFLTGTASGQEHESGPTRELLGDLPDYGERLLDMFVYLGLIVVVLLLLKRYVPRWIKRRGPSTETNLLEVIEAHHLTPGRAIHLVRVGRQYLLIGSGERGLVPLSRDELDQESLTRLIAADGAPTIDPNDRARFESYLRATATATATPPLNHEETSS